MQAVLDGSASGSPAALGTSPRTKLKRDAVLPNNQWVPLSSRHKKSKEEEVKRDVSDFRVCSKHTLSLLNYCYTIG